MQQIKWIKLRPVVVNVKISSTHKATSGLWNGERMKGRGRRSEDHERMERWGWKVSSQQPEAEDSSRLASPWRRKCVRAHVCVSGEGGSGSDPEIWLQSGVEMEKVQSKQTHTLLLTLMTSAIKQRTHTHTQRLLLHMPRWLCLQQGFAVQREGPWRQHRHFSGPLLSAHRHLVSLVRWPEQTRGCLLLFTVCETVHSYCLTPLGFATFTFSPSRKVRLEMMLGLFQI